MKKHQIQNLIHLNSVEDPTKRELVGLEREKEPVNNNDT